MNRRQFLLTSAALCGTAALGGLAPEKPAFTDLDVIAAAIALHPGRLRYQTEAEAEAAFGHFAASYGSAESLEQKFLHLSAYLATLKCGHTQCNFYNQSDAVHQALIRRDTRLPFLFVWIDGKMVVTDGSACGLPEGTIIDRIEGRPAAEILDALLVHARADGHNDAKRRAQMEVRGGEQFPPFDVYQGLLFPPAQDSFAIRYIPPGGAVQDSQLAPIMPEKRLALAPPGADDGSPLWTFEIGEDAIARLTMPTWVTYNSSWDWRSWLDKRLDEARSCRGLIVDIRGNEGGVSCGDPILARLSATDIILDDYEPRVTFQRSPPEFDPYFETYDESARFIGMQGVPIGDGFFGYPPFRPADILATDGKGFDPKTAILVDAANSSATFFFAARIKRLGLAKLVGTETGGNLRGINAGMVYFVRLPESGLEFDLPLIGYYPKERGMPDRGVLPDIAVSADAADIAAGRDPALEAARDLLTA